MSYSLAACMQAALMYYRVHSGSSPSRALFCLRSRRF